MDWARAGGVSTRSTVPAGSGLGASGALGVALVTAALAAAGVPLKPESAAEIAHLLETEELKVAGGKQDQRWAVLPCSSSGTPR